LWGAVNHFLAHHKHLRVEFENLIGNPVSEIERIVEYLGLSPERTAKEAAIHEIRPRSQSGTART
jgi:hypothetical protein